MFTYIVLFILVIIFYELCIEKKRYRKNIKIKTIYNCNLSLQYLSLSMNMQNRHALHFCVKGLRFI